MLIPSAHLNWRSHHSSLPVFLYMCVYWTNSHSLSKRLCSDRVCICENMELLMKMWPCFGIYNTAPMVKSLCCIFCLPWIFMVYLSHISCCLSRPLSLRDDDGCSASLNYHYGCWPCLWHLCAVTLTYIYSFYGGTLILCLLHYKWCATVAFDRKTDVLILLSEQPFFAGISKIYSAIHSQKGFYASHTNNISFTLIIKATYCHYTVSYAL